MYILTSISIRQGKKISNNLYNKIQFKCMGERVCVWVCVNVTLELSIYVCVWIWRATLKCTETTRNTLLLFEIIAQKKKTEKYIHRDRYNIFIRLFLSGKKECICQISVSVTIAKNTINCRHFFDISLMNCLFFFVRHTACQHIRKERKYPSRISITPWGFVCAALASITSCRHP